jgi:hypothetical protein
MRFTSRGWKSEKHPYTVMVAVVTDGRKLLAVTIVKGKTTLAEMGLDAKEDRPHRSTHSVTGWQTAEAMIQCCASSEDFRRKRMYMRSISLWIATPLIFAPRSVPDRMCSASRRTSFLQPLDRTVFGALKAEHRAICRHEMSLREGKRDEGGLRGVPGVGLGVDVGGDHPPRLGLLLPGRRDTGLGIGGGDE